MDSLFWEVVARFSKPPLENVKGGAVASDLVGGVLVEALYMS